MANLSKSLYDVAKGAEWLSHAIGPTDENQPGPRRTPGPPRRPASSPQNRRRAPRNSPSQRGRPRSPQPRQMPEQYALLRDPTRHMRAAFGAWWPMVQIIAWMGGIDLDKAARGIGKDLENLIKTLESAGFKVTPPTPGEPTTPGIAGEPPDQVPPGTPAGPIEPPEGPPPAPPTEGPGPEPPEPPGGVTIPTVMEPQLAPGREPPREAEVEWSEEALVDSSNVYSFQYHFPSSTLRVTYLAPKLAKGTVQRGKGGLRGIKAGAQGPAFKGKSNAPGASYHYFAVPVQVYRKLIRAGSPGKSVWDNLRIRGTIYGHQYRYALAGPAIVAGIDGEMGAYVPRKASRRGYISRRFREAGGRRYIESSLPPQTVNRGTPDRGEPNRGQPDRGR